MRWLLLCRSAMTVLAIAVLSGCGRGRFAEMATLERGTFVLRWEGLSGPPEHEASQWRWFCYEIDGEQGREAVKGWLAANYEALERVQWVRPLRVTPAKELCWLPARDVPAGRDLPPELAGLLLGSPPQRWSLWLNIPTGPLDPRLSKFELLERDWDTNLPYDEFERLKDLFGAHGRAIDPERPDLRELCGSARQQPTTVLQGGTFVLALGPERGPGGVPSGEWIYHRIDDDEGRKAVQAWAAANYEALKCGAAAGAVLPWRVLYWFNGQTYVQIELMARIPVGRKGSPEQSTRVENLPAYEFDLLKRVFRERGKLVDFSPDEMRATRLEVRLAE